MFKRAKPPAGKPPAKSTGALKPGAGAVFSEAGPQPRADDPIVDYLPTTWPGARLPHLWIKDAGGLRAVCPHPTRQVPRIDKAQSFLRAHLRRANEGLGRGRVRIRHTVILMERRHVP